MNGTDALFPISPPYPWFIEISGGRRASKRRRVLHAKQIMINMMVCSLSHLHLGFAMETPQRGRTGQHLGTEQLALVNECMDRVNSFCRLLKEGARQTLTNAEGVLSEMMQSLVSLDIVPYCRTRSSATFSAGPAVGRPPPGLGRHELVVDMVGFPDTIIPFDPCPYLCEDSKLADNDPTHLEKPEDSWGPAPATFSAPVGEVVRLAHRWDKVGRLAVFPATGPEAPMADELCN